LGNLGIFVEHMVRISIFCWVGVANVPFRAARISIACSILRVLPLGATRTFVLFVIASFILTCGTLATLKTVVCVMTFENWTGLCQVGKPYIVAKLVSKFFTQI
jgi:hypothetical protein